RPPPPAVQRPLAAAGAHALGRASRGATPTAAPQFSSGVLVSHPRPGSRKILGLPEPHPRSRSPTPLPGAVTLLPGGRRTSPCPGPCGTRGEGSVSSGSGRDEHFRGRGRTCPGARGVAAGVREVGVPGVGELGAGLGLRAVGKARLRARAAGLRSRASVGPQGPRTAAAGWARRRLPGASRVTPWLRRRLARSHLERKAGKRDSGKAKGEKQARNREAARASSWCGLQRRQRTSPKTGGRCRREDIWFDDVDPADIEAALGPEAARIARKQLGQSASSITLVKEQAFGGLTRALAMDCEMVGVGPKGEESVVARVSIVNQYGKCVYDKYVKPTQPVTDYRTAVSGIRPENLKQGEKLEVVQKEVADMLKGRVLVGHAVHNDLKVLFLDHPKKKIRDTQKYKPFKSQVKIQDAQAAMRLYILVKKEWESMAQDRRPTAPAPDGGSVSIPGRS
uniref:RNA exonuclease 4 n=1 Tax=Ailuropoda melanoleuca TaxID=9646 RepID=A0A7N5JJB4_AILME